MTSEPAAFSQNNHPEFQHLQNLMLERELLYRLIKGPQGHRLVQMAQQGSQGHAIARTVQWLKANFQEAMRTSDLAEQVGMGVSTFHRHFLEITGMTPVQYQKRLRLNEARRLMLAEHLDAASAAFQVGDESPSHFSREYRRAFGAPPASSIQQLRASAS
ncbi:helix-turn-helix domain-containing protein [Deinococcus roseus]|uniref:HTH araC/xylS-type domain-containing protein n=1 Tax=Deinococcus roseus TaxID=392414 RepID=A0ABQ2D0U1_9DEIO|nr:AraC family transcriptional regulator [Deinococcus roseus]GGJ36436.1 hypothetical protein GCM10008938_23150 [Deinococcus roseus]